jgi:uncharacterized SAM-binding protein YcdF (DUF218 family)
MSLFLLFVMLFLATVLAMLGWRRCSHILFGVVLVLFLAIGCGPLPKVLVARLQAPYAARPPLDWAPSNAIVLLTGGAVAAPGEPVEPGMSAFSRIAEATLLYRGCTEAGAKCTVLVTGGDASWVGGPLAPVYAETLRRLGVPSKDLVLETRSLDTWQNALFSRPLLERIGAQRVWLVTSGFHMRRAMLDFADAGIVATAVRSDYLKVLGSAVPKAANFQLMDTVLHEFAGVAAYHLYRMTGRNPHAMPSWHAVPPSVARGLADPRALPPGAAGAMPAQPEPSGDRGAPMG